jgi:hypothetical protein
MAARAIAATVVPAPKPSAQLIEPAGAAAAGRDDAHEPTVAPAGEVTPPPPASAPSLRAAGCAATPLAGGRVSPRHAAPAPAPAKASRAVGGSLGPSRRGVGKAKPPAASSATAAPDGARASEALHAKLAPARALPVLWVGAHWGLRWEAATAGCGPLLRVVNGLLGFRVRPNPKADVTCRLSVQLFAPCGGPDGSLLLLV